MMELVTSAQMRGIEQAAIESGMVTGALLMERAGAGVVAAVMQRYPALAGGAPCAAVLCGPGNNGGDGFVIARVLHDRGWRVHVLVLGDPARLRGDARAMFERWVPLGSVNRLDDAGAGLHAVCDSAAPDLIVDALFGTGLARPVAGAPARAIADLNQIHAAVARPPVVVAVDVPSGVCADSGRVLGVAARADLCVTFHRAKPGHYLAEGPDHCGAGVVVVDIGLPQAPLPGAVRLVGPGADLAKRAGHKFAHGHALVLSGGLGRSGAARLAARAALRVGAGLVTVAAPGPAMAECAAQLTAIMLRQVDLSGALIDLLVDDRITAVCMGPGLGHGTGTRSLVLSTLQMFRDTPRALVLDADALTQFTGYLGRPEDLFAWTAQVPRCVLTPHDGEFSRLFPDLASRLEATPTYGPACARVDIARVAAARAGCTVLMKGPDTVIASPDGTAAIHAARYDRAAPWLATAGAGDVLAGLITGLMARGLGAHDAACSGAWLHAEAARLFGPGLIAEDLPDLIPRVLAAS